MIDKDGIERVNCRIHLRNDVEFTSPDNIFMKGMIIDHKGTVVAQHSHEYYHTSLLTRGSVRVWKDGHFLGDFEAPAFIPIEAKCKHKFQSLEDNTAVYCIHNVSQTGGQVEIHEEVREIV